MALGRWPPVKSMMSLRPVVVPNQLPLKFLRFVPGAGSDPPDWRSTICPYQLPLMVLLLIVSSAGIFYGVATPSLQNAGLELAPSRIAALAGLRAQVPALSVDRYLAPDIETAAGLVHDGTLAQVFRSLAGLPALWTPA